LGNPLFAPLEEISSEILEAEIRRFHDLMNLNSLTLQFCQGPYADEIIYRFITEEFLHQSIDDVRVPGMVTGFIYEEFHPNHHAEISALTKDFFNGWFDRGFNDHKFLFYQEVRINSGSKMPVAQLITKIENFFQAFKRFEKCKHVIDKVSWELISSGNSDDEIEAQGIVEGRMRYDGLIDHGEFIYFEGKYRFDLIRSYGCWFIENLEVQGFKG
jgi:hypothetical protein